MSDPSSVILADIHMVRTENNIVKPMNPPFYKRFVDDIYSKRNQSQQDVLFEALNNFHPNINLSIEINPEKFLDTKIILNNERIVTTQEYQKEKKKDWVSKIPKRYKRNITSTGLLNLEKQHQISTSKSEQSKQNTTKLDTHSNLSKVSFEILLHLQIKMNRLSFHQICSQ